MLKLFIIAVSVFMLLGLGGVAAQPDSNSRDNSQQAQQREDEKFFTVIDDIEIPFDVLLGVHRQHIGYAVIQADQVTMGSEDVYRLEVMQYDEPETSEEGFYMFFDSDWDLIDESEFVIREEEDDDNNDDDDDGENGETDDNGSENGNENVGGETSENEDVPSRDPNEDDAEEETETGNDTEDDTDSESDEEGEETSESDDDVAGDEEDDD